MKTAHHNNFGPLRLLLALMVVLGHFKTLPGLEQPTGIFSFANLGVKAFFVVSGYLVFASFDKLPNLYSFYIRRLFRIYPLYGVTILLQAVVMTMLLGGFALYLGEFLHYLLPNLVMMNFLAYDVGGLLKHLHNPGINPSLWTLKIEVGFYAIVPLLWWLTRRFGVGVLLVIFFASTLYHQVALHYEKYDLARQLPGQLRYFTVGILLYRYQYYIRLSPWQAAGLVILLFLVCVWGQKAFWMVTLSPIVIGLMVFAIALKLPAVPLRTDISYGVYLLHGPMIQLALLLGFFQDTIPFLLALLAAVVALSLVAERLVERPGIALGIQLAKRPRKEESAAREQLS